MFCEIPLHRIQKVEFKLSEQFFPFIFQFNGITSITDDTFCKANDTRYVRERIEEIRLEGNPIVLGKHPNSFICLKILPVGSYF